MGTSDQNNDNESEGNEPQSLTYFPQTKTNPESLVLDDQEDLADVERDDEIHNETENKGNENVTTGKNEVSKVNKAATERRQDVKNMLKNRKDKKMDAKLSTESQLLQICRDDVDYKKKKKKLLEKIDGSDKEFRAGFTELNTIGTAIQQSVGILGQLVGQGMPNHTRMLSPQTYQDQMHQHQMYQYQMHRQQMHQNQITYQQRGAYPTSSTITSPITIIITQHMVLVGMISRISTIIMNRNIKICRNIKFFLNDSFVVLFTIIDFLNI